ncbi:hypothetical protein GOP47_0026892 [Adiantum capillus-veneris]|nr:hypothetical protein GOP47_0026258 [Adiantum capillus-veneris]KAI5058722.1 hypothetical protein GOP47_0026892 [Adiantum capillus-veneris]
MLMQVGGVEGSRPTFFEMAAAQQLPASLRAALLYSLGVLAQRTPILHKILDHSDEAFCLLMLVLEAHSLRTTDASFAESLYGLRRRPVGIKLESKGQAAEKVGITRRHRYLSLLFLVALPYLKSKAQAVYDAQSRNISHADMWRSEDIDEDISSVDTDVDVVSNQNDTQADSFRDKLKKSLVKLYPWIHATQEGLSFSYQLLYLLDATHFYTLALQIMGLHVCRASGQELMDASSQIAERRNREFERLRGPRLAQAFQRAALKTLYNTLDFAQTGLIASVFLFKMMEWWYQSAEERVTAPTMYPAPPPPPAPKVAEKGIPLPKDKRVCPLCMKKRTNPALVASSGFVFCYPCIFSYVSQYNRCPVTLVPAAANQIRRLFYDS